MPRNVIMLVDDEPRLLAGLRRRLSTDFEVVTFERGADAIKYLSEPHNVKVIVADMQMPEMNGIELLKNIKDIAPDVRRLMLTGNSDQETAMAAINEGKVFRFIRKPCDAVELKTIIQQAIEDFEFNNSDLDTLSGTPVSELKHVDVQKNFLSVISDELRTPLSQIVTMSEVLNKDSVALDPHTLSNFLALINKSGVSALRQVDRILEYTRLQSDNTKDMKTENCDIVEIFNREIKSSKLVANEKFVTFSVETLHKQANVVAPRRSASLMVKELVDNAVKFSPLAGHVSVILKYDKKRVAVRISNDGPGLLPQVKDTAIGGVIAPFQAQDTELARGHGGLGLGLSLVHAVAEKYDIQIGLQSCGGRGAAVTLIFDQTATLPFALPQLKLQHKSA